MDILVGFLPEGLTATSAGILIFVSFFTAALTAAVGVGGGLLMLGLMTYLIPIAALIPVHGLVQLGSNSSRSYLQRAHIDWRFVRIFLFGSVFGALVGVALSVQLPAHILRGFLGIFIIVVVWIKLPKIEKANSSLIGVGGLITTFISMFVGATGPLVAVFLSKVFEKHRQMVATHGMMMTIQHSLKVLAFGLAGFAFWEWLPVVLIIVATGFAGAKVGTLVMDKIPEEGLKFGFKIIMTIVAIDLMRSWLI